MLDLSAAGLSETEAKTYTALISRNAWKPSDLAKNVGETRTNMYKILDKLIDFGLAERFDKDRKLHYRATNPSRLLELAREQRMEREQAEKQLELASQDLMAAYITTHEQPGIRFFQGKEQIKEIFEDILTTAQPVYLVRSHSDVQFYDEEFFNSFRQRRADCGIVTHAITPATAHAKANLAEDAAMNFVRCLIPQDAYTGSVEWNAYGDKLAIISYGKEAIGMIIESPQIAESFRQLTQLMRSSAADSTPK